MKLKNENHVAFYVSSVASAVLAAFYIPFMIDCFSYKNAPVYIVKQTLFFLTFLCSAVLFIAAPAFEKLSDKFTEGILLVQSVTALAGAFIDLRLSSFSDDFFESVCTLLFGLFFLFLFVWISFDDDIFPLMLTGVMYSIMCLVIKPVLHDEICFHELAISVVMWEYMCCFVLFSEDIGDFASDGPLFDNVSSDGDSSDIDNEYYFDPDDEVLLVRRLTAKLKAVVPVAVISAVFVFTTVYLVLTNCGVVSGFDKNTAFELLNYVSLFFLAAFLSCKLIKMCGFSPAARLLIPYFSVLAVTVVTACLNSFYNALFFNLMRGDIPFFHQFAVLLKENILYSDGSFAKLRYPAVLLFNIVLQFVFCALQNRKFRKLPNNKPEQDYERDFHIVQ